MFENFSAVPWFAMLALGGKAAGLLDSAFVMSVVLFWITVPKGANACGVSGSSGMLRRGAGRVYGILTQSTGLCGRGVFDLDVVEMSLKVSL